MPKQILEIKEALSRGLRPDENIDRNTDFLLDASGYRPTPFGASMFEGVTQPYMTQVAHPFPQLFVGDKYRILADAEEVGTFDAVWSYTADVLRDIAAYVSPGIMLSVPGDIPLGGGPWQFANYGDNYFLFNGETIAFRYNEATTTNVFTSSSVLAKTGCIFRGRLFLGGLSSLVSSTFNTQVDTFRTESPSETYSFDDNFIWWSSVGLEDAYWWFFPWTMTKDKYIDILNRQESGFMRMPWQGSVIAMMPLGNGIVVYGEEGISYVEQLYSEDTGTAMKHTLLSATGIASRGAVGGDELFHLYIDREGTFWSLDSRLQPERLGYKEFGSDLIQRPVTISYDQVDREFYISNNLKAYIRTDSGFARIPQLITSCVFVDDFKAGFYEELNDTHETSFRAWTDVFDFGTRSVKTIYELQIDTESPKDFKASVYYRNNSAEQFRQSIPVDCETDSRIPITATGVEFIIRIEAESGKHKRLDRVQVVWDIRSKRSFDEYL
jgi:hypothetical protein